MQIASSLQKLEQARTLTLKVYSRKCPSIKLADGFGAGDVAGKQRLRHRQAGAPLAKMGGEARQQRRSQHCGSGSREERQVCEPDQSQREGPT